MQKEMNSRKAKNINYTIFATVVVIAIILVVNLFVRAIDSKYTELSVSPTDIYTLSDTTLNMLKNVDKEVTIYTIAEPGSEDIAIETIVGRYASNCKKISREIVDPTVDHKFVADNIGEAVRQGSLLVKSGDNKVFIDIADMRYTVNTQSGETREMVDVEGLITAAIAKVTSEHTPKAYILMAANRSYMDKSVIESIEKQNIDVTEIEVDADTPLPEDAEVVILYAPPTDLSDIEYKALDEFMEKGGKLLYLMFYDYMEADDKKNIGNLFRDYGISFPKETVIEGDPDYYVDGEKPFQIYPIMQKHEITQSLIDAESKVLFNMSGRIQIDEVPADVKVDILLKTSLQSYIRVSGDTTTTFDPNKDFRSEYDLAAAITDSTTKAKAVVFASYALAYEETDTIVNGANVQMLVNSLCWLTDQEEIVSVPAKFRGLSKLVYTAKDKNVLMATTIFIIPAAILGWGLVVWIRRRRK